MEDHFHTIVDCIEQLASTDCTQDGVVPFINYVVSGHWWLCFSLHAEQTSLDFDQIFFCEQLIANWDSS